MEDLTHEVISLESDLDEMKAKMKPLQEAFRELKKRKHQLLVDISAEQEARGEGDIEYQGYTFGRNTKQKLMVKKGAVFEALGKEKTATFIEANTVQKIVPFMMKSE